MSTIQTLRSKAEEFRQMHFGADVLVLPNAWDHSSAAIFERAGFPAIATTSSGMSFANGYPDGERLGRNRMMALIEGIVAQTKVPVTGDLEAGYGRAAEDVAVTVTRGIEIGLVGCNIEDTDPRTGELFDFDLSVARIRAARSVADRLDVPFVLNARSDPFLRPVDDADVAFAEAVRRANAYLEVGATCAFIPGPGDAETVGRLVRAIDGPLNILAGRAGRAGLSLDELRTLGVRRVSIGGSLMLAAAAFVRRVASTIRTEGDFSYALDAITGAEMNAIMNELSAL